MHPAFTGRWCCSASRSMSHMFPSLRSLGKRKRSATVTVINQGCTYRPCSYKATCNSLYPLCQVVRVSRKLLRGRCLAARRGRIQNRGHSALVVARIRKPSSMHVPLPTKLNVCGMYFSRFYCGPFSHSFAWAHKLDQDWYGACTAGFPYNCFWGSLC